MQLLDARERECGLVPEFMGRCLSLQSISHPSASSGLIEFEDCGRVPSTRALIG